MSLTKDGETPSRAKSKVGQVKTKKTLAVEWMAAEIEAVPVLLTTGLEIRAVDRFLLFVRSHNPNYARYSATNDPQRGKPTLVI